MNLANLQTVKQICQRLNVRPSKSFGQNFLVSPEILDKIIIAANLKNTDHVLEIGPGLGTLTNELVKKAGQVIAVEADQRLATYLPTAANLKIVKADILKLSLEELGLSDKSYKVVSNLPYQITSPVIWRFLTQEKNKPTLLLLMIQREVADRMVALPGRMSLLAVVCQSFAEVEKIIDVDSQNFYPAPKVDSALIVLQPKSELPDKKFIKLVKTGFAAKRKMLKNNLAAGWQLPAGHILDIFKKINIKANVRPQDLSVNDWQKLNQILV